MRFSLRLPVTVLLGAGLLILLPGTAIGAQGPAARPDPDRRDHIAVAWVTSADVIPESEDRRTSDATGRHIERVEWIPHPDGRRLAVFPTDYGRYDAPASAWPAAWDEVIHLEPGVGHEHMRDQFRCHVEFARLAEPDKPSWNLELWRPDVDYLGTVVARCNP